MSIETLAREVLAANGGVVALVQSGSVVRIYPMELPQTPTFPAITYQGISKTTEYTHDEAGMVRCRLQVDAWATTYLAAKALARAIRDAFHQYPGNVDGVQDFEALNERDLPEDVVDGTTTRRLHRVSCDFYAWSRDQAA